METLPDEPLSLVLFVECGCLGVGVVPPLSLATDAM